jgi:hypothetical protein
MCIVDASPDTTVVFRGVGVTIDLTFSEEAHPGESIWHNATLTANIGLTLHNLTLVIKAPVDSTWQETTGWYLFNRVLTKDENRTEEMYFPLPSSANGTIQCFIFVNTSQSIHYMSTTFYTTRVSELTFSEMQSLYDEMLANYTMLQANYTMQLNKYEDLLANYTSLFNNYTTLLSQHDQLKVDYNNQVATYNSLLNSYNLLETEFNALTAEYTSQLSKSNTLQSDYNLLNSTYFGVQDSYTDLQAVYDVLNQTYNDLLVDINDLQGTFSESESALNTFRVITFIITMAVAALIVFIIYLKRKKQEPYVVIRKETFRVEQNESS